MEKITNNKRKRFFANKMHKEICLILFLAAIIPAFIIAICMYYLIFSVMAEQMLFPEAIAYNIIPAAKKVALMMLALAPFSIIIILSMAYKITHRIVGPYERIVRELDEHLENKRGGHIILRKNDKFLSLVERINKLLDRISA